MKVKGQVVTRENWRDVVVPANMTIDELIDVLGRLNEQRKFLVKLEKFCKESISGKRDEEFDEDFGLFHVLRTKEPGKLSPNKEEIITDVSELLAAAGLEMTGEQWWEDHQKRGDPFWQVKIKRIDGHVDESEEDEEE